MAFEVRRHFQVRIAGQVGGAPGDVHRQVSHAFQVVIDLEHGDDKAQVDGYGLVQGQDLEAVLLHLHFHEVDFFVPFGHLIGQLGVVPDHRGNGLGNTLLHGGADGEDLLLEVIDFALKVLAHGVLLA